MPPHRSNLAACCLALFLIPQLGNAAMLYDEFVDPEISDDHLSPTPLALAIGSCDIAGTMRSSNGIDREYIALTVPAGAVLTSIVAVNYAPTPAEDQSFIGIAPGSTLPDPATITAGDLSGAALFGTADIVDPDIEMNLLARMNGNLGSTGYTTPLPAGTYTMWIQETGAFDIEWMLALEISAVPEPSSTALLGIASLAMLRRRR